jgi:hypothetical protein
MDTGATLSARIHKTQFGKLQIQLQTISSRGEFMKSHVPSLYRLLAILVPTLMLICSLPAVSAQSKPLSGSFGVLLNASIASTSNDSGSAVLGLLNFDGMGNVTGSYNLQIGDSADNPGGQSVTGTLTGTYSTNPDGTGAATLNLDAGLSFTYAMVITDGGKGLTLITTGCTSNCDLGGIVIGGVARAAYTGPLKGSYGYQFNNSPVPGQSVGVATFDGAGNTAVSLTFVGAGMGPDHDPHQAPVFTGTANGTYSLNPDGSGTIVLPKAFGGQGDQMYAFVVVDGGSAILLEQMKRSGSGVSSGTARLQ